MASTYQVVFRNPQGQYGTLVLTEDEALAREAYEVHRRLAAEQNQATHGQSVQEIELRKTDVLEHEAWKPVPKLQSVPRI